ncbi:MAG TPA: hypothetical protein VJY33_09800 [Isosphaeraceae bacterium]|nr:hypothetical protein [Isosphaeraceae bacterium]
MSANRPGVELGKLIADIARDEAALRTLIPGRLAGFLEGLERIVGCDQGRLVHFEGDVAVHAAKVVANLARLAPLDPLCPVDHVDWVAALLHDSEKPACRVEAPNGAVWFPGHERRAALLVPAHASRLRLTPEEEAKLQFLVGEHGNAHLFPNLPGYDRRRLAGSPHWRNLRLLQRADAEGCYLNPQGTEWLPDRWDDFAREAMVSGLA